MKIFIYSYLFLVGLSFALAVNVLAQNPIIRNQFTADPSARVFNGKVYLYPSHDIPPEKGKCRENWFCMAVMNFGGVEENVVTRDEFPLSKAKEVLKDEVIAVIGYGVQGPGQSLNLRDNGFNVIVGQRKNSKSWDKAIADGWVPGKTLFEIEEAAKRGTIIQYLLSDAAQIEVWPVIKKHLTPGKALYFSHGFGITYKDRTGIVPPPDVDVILVAPKGSGTSLRKMFLEGRGLNSSYAIFQDATGKAYDRVIALGIGIGSGYLFETTFEREVYSDLTGERGTLMGAIQGLFLAQYETLREHGHTPSEAFNETVEELTQSLMPLVAENGMDWMYANCSTTAQRGALDWMGPFHDAVKPVFEKLYNEVASGNEAQRAIDANSQPDYREKLEEELKALRESEMWKTGAVVRKLRPENN
jgi:ketol-acid reductoisomerase